MTTRSPADTERPSRPGMVAIQAFHMHGRDCCAAPAAALGRSAPGTLAALEQAWDLKHCTLGRGADRWVTLAAMAAPLSRPTLTVHRSAAAAATSASAPARSRLQHQRTIMGMPLAPRPTDAPRECT